jgi:hypothetical protein
MYDYLGARRYARLIKDASLSFRDNYAGVFNLGGGMGGRKPVRTGNIAAVRKEEMDKFA